MSADHLAADPLARNELGERLLALLENAPGAIFIKDAAGRYTFVSKSFAGLADRPLEEIIGRDDLELFGPELAVAFKAEDDAIRADGGSLRFCCPPAKWRQSRSTSPPNARRKKRCD
jgi:PAS domain-containing protein